PLVSGGRDRLCRLVLPLRTLGLLAQPVLFSSNRLPEFLGSWTAIFAWPGGRRLRYGCSPAGRKYCSSHRRLVAVSVSAAVLDARHAVWSSLVLGCLRALDRRHRC